MSKALFCLVASWPGRLDRAALAPALDATIDNAWAPLAEMAADALAPSPLGWMPFERERALDIIDKERRTLLLRQHAGPGAIEAQVWSYADDTSLILYLPALPDPRLRTQLVRSVSCLPDGAYGTVQSTTVQAPLPSSVLPVHLAAGPWLAMLPAAARERWFSRQTLLKAPAALVEETPDGTIWLTLYRDPIAPRPDELQDICAWLENTAAAGTSQ